MGDRPYFGGVVKLTIHKLLRARKLTAYQLAKLAGIPLSSAYRLARPGGVWRRIDARTVDRLCAALRCQPGELFAYIPDRKH